MLVPLTLLAAVANVPLTPKGPWNVHAAQSDCMLLRNYDAGGKTISVVFQPSVDGGSVAISVLSPEYKATGRTGEGEVIRSPDGRTFASDYHSVATAD